MWIAFSSIGAAILSHHVNKFTLVTAFFLFSVGCLNMTLGLIFRELAKSKRSIRAWRNGDNAGTLPMHSGDLATPKFHPSLFGGQPAETSEHGEKSSGLGFGTQGEKQAGLRGTAPALPPVGRCDAKLCFSGFMITKPSEAVPHYVPRPASLGSSFYSVVEPKSVEPSTSGFRSSPTAI